VNVHYWNSGSYDIENYGIQAIFNGMTSMPSFMKMYKNGSTFIIGNTQMDRQTAL
jgi:hypothetical protein